MRTFIVTKDNTDYARTVTDWMRDFSRQTGKVLKTIDPESPEGSSTCAAYDIVEYPTVIALDDSGVMQIMWRGLPLPTISEVSYYA